MKLAKMILMVACLAVLPTSCTTSTSSDPELKRIENSLSTARGALVAAEVGSGFVISDPKTTPATIAATNTALMALRRQVEALEKQRAEREAFLATIKAAESLPVDAGHMPTSIILPPPQ